ncbi:hypothetical protein [Streptomyces formicae]|uniref:Uncharacterized protein n=1 Tax=Streptomyces formicae TaxID=1616117 RepID=A0ABY3WVI0_9ACTN|nr:hypothetical protein [Streptomyces formicae]UNM15307.1 hypothetical protein J4032_31005 [Streptomyces formicae]
MPQQLEQLKGRSRVTLFPLEGLTVAYTTQSSDERGLGDIGIVAVTDPHMDAAAAASALWVLARSMWARTSNGQEQARWILTQATRARVVRAPSHEDLPDVEWTAELTRRFQLDGLFANHEILTTGRLALV